MLAIRKYLIQIYYAIGAIMVSPLIILFCLTKNRHVIILDVRKWSEIDGIHHKSDIIKLLRLLFIQKAFRNLYYYRIEKDNLLTEILTYFLGMIYAPLPTLELKAEKCGHGLYFTHGVCCIIRAKNIGDNCRIYQQVTIGGYGKNDYPIIGNNVWITSGAKVIGDIVVGDNSVIGANAVVLKNVPENCVVVGVPAYIVKRNGIRVNEPL